MFLFVSLLLNSWGSHNGWWYGIFSTFYHSGVQACRLTSQYLGLVYIMGNCSAQGQKKNTLVPAELNHIWLSWSFLKLSQDFLLLFLFTGCCLNSRSCLHVWKVGGFWHFCYCPSFQCSPFVRIFTLHHPLPNSSVPYRWTLSWYFWALRCKLGVRSQSGSVLSSNALLEHWSRVQGLFLCTSQETTMSCKPLVTFGLCLD